MKNKLIFATLGSVIVILVAVIAYRIGKEKALIAEFKVYSANLTSVASESFPYELREYFKARFYYLGNRIPIDWLPTRDIDFGPCDEELLKYVNSGKEAYTLPMEYKLFIDRLEKRNPK